MGCTKHEFTPGETLPAAKVNEIQDAIIALEDGTNPAGDSAKLGGKDASEYVTTADDTNRNGWNDLSEGFDLNNAFGKYRAYTWSVLNSLVNAPPELSPYGAIEVEYIPIAGNYYGIQILRELVNTNTNVYVRSVNANAWGGWKQIATIADLANIQTTSNATFSESGWYRIAEFSNETEINNNSCFIELRKTSSQGESILLRLESTNNKKVFSVVSAASDMYHDISKVRYAKSATNSYIEVYINRDWSFGYYSKVFDGSNLGGVWKALPFVATSETVEGVTVTTTYDIPANASPVTDLDLANYFKNTGGIISGDITQTRSSATPVKRILQNTVRNITEYVSADGRYALADGTNNKNIIDSAADGTNTFNGTASGNLPLSGGGKIQKSGYDIIELENTAYYNSFIAFRGTNGRNGAIGFLNVNRPAIMNDKQDTFYDLLHTGNSAKVAIQETAPTDGLWVW